MGLLDSAPSSPLLDQSAGTRPAAPKPAAPVVAAPKEPEKNAPKAPEPAKPTAPAPDPLKPVNTTAGAESALAAIGRLERERNNISKPPSKPDLPEKPKSVQEHVSLWGALAIAFAGFASLRTRTPMTSALNAAGSALKAMQGQQKEEADKAYKEWEQQTKIAMETSNYERQAYRDLMSEFDRSETTAAKVGELRDNAAEREQNAKVAAFTTMMKDPIMYQAYQHGMEQGGAESGLKAMRDVQEQRDAQARKLDEMAKPIVEAKVEQDNLALIEKSKEYKQAQADGDTMKMFELRARAAMPGGAMARTLNLTPLPEDQVAKVVDLIGQGKLAYPSEHAIDSTAAGRQIADGVTTKYPDYDPTDFKELVQAKRQLIGKDGDNIRSFTVLTHHLAFFEALSSALKDSDFSDSTTLNAITNRVARQFGMPNVPTFEFAKEIVGDELTKAILGSGAGTGGDRDKMKEQLDAALTKEQLDGVIKAGRTFTTGQLAGQLSKYRHLMEIGWLKPDDVVPTKTLRELEVTSTPNPAALLAPGAPGGDRISVEGSGLSIPNPGGASAADGAKPDAAKTRDKPFDEAKIRESLPAPLAKLWDGERIPMTQKMRDGSRLIFLFGPNKWYREDGSENK